MKYSSQKLLTNVSKCNSSFSTSTSGVQQRPVRPVSRCYPKSWRGWGYAVCRFIFAMKTIQNQDVYESMQILL